MHDLAWHELSARLALALAQFLWQGTLVALVVFTLLRLLRGNSRVRYGIALCALTVMAALPVVMFCAVNTPEEWWRSETVQSRPMEIVAHDVQDASPMAALAESPSQSVPPGSTTAPPVTPALPFTVPAMTQLTPSGTAPPSSPPLWIAATPWVATIYFAGVLLMLVRVSLGIRGNQLLRRNSRPITDSTITARLRERAAALRLRITPTLAVCEQIAVPTVIGVLRPLILLPASLVSGLPFDQLDAVLTHELAHIGRWDPVVNFLQRLIEAVLFFHPGVWYVSRKVRESREHCCDDLVVSLGVNPVEYATSLLDVAEHAVRSPSRLALPRPAAALQATGQRSQLGGRVRRLLGAAEPESLRVKHPGFVLVLIFALSLGLTMAALNSRAAPEPESAETTGDAAKYEVTLPNGSTVRLLGVTEYPYEGKPWWTADGTPSDPPPGRINGSSTYNGPPVISRLIVLEATGLPIGCRTEAALTPTRSSAIGNDRAGAGPHRVTFIGRFDPAATTCEADFKFASGTWTTAEQFDRDGKPLGEATAAGREVAFEEIKTGDGSWGQTEVIFTTANGQTAWRAHVVTTDKQRLLPVHDQWGKQGDEDRTRYRYGFDVPRDQVERIVIEQDSFAFGVRFSGISLHPGQKSEVQIKTETADVLPPAVFADMVARAVLERAQWPHLAERRSSLSREQAAAEFRELVTKYAPREMSREQYQSLLSSIERQMQTDGWRNAPVDDLDYHDWCYLHAPELLRNLQWRLYLALIREPLTGEQKQRLDQQRDWMRDYVRGLPAVDPAFRDKTHEGVLRALEDKFADPLCPAFHEPLADDKFAVLRTEIESLDRARGLIVIEHHLTWEAARGLMRSDAAEIPVPELTGFHERAQSFGAGNGVLRVEFPSTSFHKGMPNNLSDYPDGNIIVSQPAYIMLWGGVPQEAVAMGLDAIQAYCADNKVGDFLFDAKNRRLVGLRGAKLLPLPTEKATRWYDIDELPTDRLRNIIRQDGKEFCALPEPYQVSNVGEERLHQYVGLLLPDDRVLVIHLSQLAFGQLSLRVRAHDTSDEPAAGGPAVRARERRSDSQFRAGDIAMPLYYEDTMLVVHNENGAAAIKFDTPAQEGDLETDGRHVVRYRWRFRDDRDEEQTGEGEVFEHLPDNDFERGRWFIEAGPMRLAWSRAGDKQGWVYFNPDQVSVHPVKSDWFENLPLVAAGEVQQKLDLLQFLLPDPDIRKSYQTREYHGPGTIPGYPRHPYATPVRYATTLLIVATPDGVAAYRFGKSYAGDVAAHEARFGVKYEFRYVSLDGATKLDGRGEVYELYRNGQYQDEGTLHHLEAGPVHLPWSQGGPESGWIYFDPAWNAVWFAKPELLNDGDDEGAARQKLDLLRFRVGDRPLPPPAATTPTSGPTPSANEPASRKEFVWGEPVDGLQVGIRLAERPFEAVSAADQRYAFDVQFRNTTDRDITVPVVPYVHPGKDPLSSTPHWNALASIKDEDRVCRVTIMALLEPDQDARDTQPVTIPAGTTVDLPGGPVTLRMTENSGTATPEPSVHYEFVRQTYPFNRFPNDPKLRFEIRVAPIAAAPGAKAKTAFSGPATLEFDDPRIASGSTTQLLDNIDAVLGTQIKPLP